jgi:hypothetical protein
MQVHQEECAHMAVEINQVSVTLVNLRDESMLERMVYCNGCGTTKVLSKAEVAFLRDGKGPGSVATLQFPSCQVCKKPILKVKTPEI